MMLRFSLAAARLGGLAVLAEALAPAEAATEQVLHSFGGPGDGQLPFVGMINVGGTLYGTTYRGGANGLVGGADGAHPNANVGKVGQDLYTTTELGGAYGQGTVVKVTP